MAQKSHGHAMKIAILARGVLSRSRTSRIRPLHFARRRCHLHAICKFEQGAAAGFLGVICSFTGQIEQKRASRKGQA
jgi:hypothetical protein